MLLCVKEWAFRFLNVPGNQLPILEEWLSSAEKKQSAQPSQGTTD